MVEIATLEIGDRVRTLASLGDLEEGSKGTVVAVQGEQTEVRIDGSLDDFLIQGSQLEKIIPLYRRAGTGEIERTRALYGVKYVGSGTPEELLEVEGHLQSMIDEGMTYLFMERFLMTYRYQPAIIRRAFFNLTGLTPQGVVNEPFVRSPGCIPQFTLGWGKAKDGKGYCFVMPMTLGHTNYVVFQQVDDMTRHEVSRHREEMDAIESCKKLVKDLERWNPPVKDIKREDVDPTQLYRQPQMFMKASYVEMQSLLGTVRSASERRALICQAFEMGKIDKPQLDELLKTFSDAEQTVEQESVIEKLKEVESDLMKRPLQEELSEKTPQDFFDREEIKERYVTAPANIIDGVTRYIDMIGERLRDFRVSMGPFKFVPLQAAQKSDASDASLLSAVAAVMMILDVYDKAAPAPHNHKKAGMVFAVIGNEIHTSDTIKGGDNVIYGLTDEGLSKYFQKERNLARG